MTMMTKLQGYEEAEKRKQGSARENMITTLQVKPVMP